MVRGLPGVGTKYSPPHAQRLAWSYEGGLSSLRTDFCGGWLLFQIKLFIFLLWYQPYGTDGGSPAPGGCTDTYTHMLPVATQNSVGRTGEGAGCLACSSFLLDSLMSNFPGRKRGCSCSKNIWQGSIFHVPLGPVSNNLSDTRHRCDGTMVAQRWNVLPVQ